MHDVAQYGHYDCPHYTVCLWGRQKIKQAISNYVKGYNMQRKSSSGITEQEHQASVRVKEDSSEEMMFKLCFSALKLWDQFSKPIRVEVNCNKTH